VSADLGPAVAEHVAWLRLRGLSERTIGLRLTALAQLAGHIAPTPLPAASSGQLDSWQRSLANGGRDTGPDRTGPGRPRADTLKAKSRATYVEQVTQFYRWAHRTGRTAQDPSTVLVMPRVPKRRPHPMAEADLSRALGAAPPLIRVWLLLAGYAGLRAGEVAGLTREDLDAVPGMLRVIGKGDKERFVPLAPLVLAALVAFGLPAAGPLFPGVTAKTLSARCNRWLHQFGIRESVHSLRHRFGTEFYQATKDIRATQELLGHASVVTTQVYTLPDAAGMVAAVVALAERLAVSR